MYVTPIRVNKVLDPLPHDWSYYHARLKCGLVKGKYVGEVFQQNGLGVVETLSQYGVATQTNFTEFRPVIIVSRR